MLSDGTLFSRRHILISALTQFDDLIHSNQKLFSPTEAKTSLNGNHERAELERQIKQSVFC